MTAGALEGSQLPNIPGKCRFSLVVCCCSVVHPVNDLLANPPLANPAGMTVSKNSWVYKKLDGFGKNNSSGKIFYETGGRYAENGMNYEVGGAGAPGNNTAQQTRPVTAAAAADLRRSMPNIHFAPFNATSNNDDGAVALVRPQTASASMLRAKADRTGKYFFQSKVPAAELTRKLVKVRASSVSGGWPACCYDLLDTLTLISPPLSLCRCRPLSRRRRSSSDRLRSSTTTGPTTARARWGRLPSPARTRVT